MHFRVLPLLLLILLGKTIAVQFPCSEWKLATYNGAIAWFHSNFLYQSNF